MAKTAVAIVLDALDSWVLYKNTQPTRKDLLDSFLNTAPFGLQDLATAIETLVASGDLVERGIAGYPGKRLAVPGKRMAPFWSDGEGVQYDAGVA